MKYLKMLGLAAVAAVALIAVAAGSASATTLEVVGVAKNESVTLITSLKAGTSETITDTFGSAINTCTESTMHGSTTSSTTGGVTTHNSYTGAELTAPLTAGSGGLSFAKCERNPVTVHKAGTLHIKWTSGTNGTVSSSGAEWTTPSPFGTLNCRTGTGTHLGSLSGTGSSSAHAVLTINASLSCSGVSSKWEATYTVTSPTGLGVVDTAPATTTLEVDGVAKGTSVALSASLKAGSSAFLKDTFGFSSNTCTTSAVEGSSSSPFSGATVTGVVSSLTFSNCERSPVIVDKAGILHIKWTSGTNGTVSSSGAEVTTGSPFGPLNCKTGESTHLGTLTGVKSGHATMDFNASLSCSGISSKWEATYTVTSPTGLGVVS